MRPLALMSLLAVASSGCAARMIPNTDVEDTDDNREVVEFVEQYRHAMEARNPGQILRLVSESYYDDNGTPTTEDDIDYGLLQERVARLAEDVIEVRYEMRYRRVTFRSDRVVVDFTYTGRFKVQTAEGERWARRLADNRLELVRENGEYRIVSGL
ncbi:SnoaL-like domain-containing protein [Sandaracinus amylolyticus]|nr:SnoaL-like domain-containing protein [Sandaracinus amylolyticus]